jgi:hypothetical protein
VVIGCGDERSPSGITPPEYVVAVGDSITVISYPSYEVSIRRGNPFGIVSLETPDQFGNFAHWSLPLGDWEWMWYDEDGRDNLGKQIKLIEPGWEPPTISESRDGVQLEFYRKDAILAGLNLEVQYLFKPGGTFTITYVVENKTGGHLPMPYVMVGFPGFTNHKWVTAVGTRLGPYFPKPPHLTFWEQAISEGRAESTIASDEAGVFGDQPLKGLIVISMFGRSYMLQAKYSPSEDVAQAHSAHVNKPGYLTSHLYVLLNDMLPDAIAKIKVDYRISIGTSEQ